MYESSLAVMMNALKEVQKRGDEMMGVINEQWEELAGLQYKVECEREILEKTKTAAGDFERQRKSIEWAKKLTEKQLTRVKSEKENKEKKMKELEHRKLQKEISLQSLGKKAELARQEVDANKEELIRYF